MQMASHTWSQSLLIMGSKLPWQSRNTQGNITSKEKSVTSELISNLNINSWAEFRGLQPAELHEQPGKHSCLLLRLATPEQRTIAWEVPTAPRNMKFRQ